MIGHWLGMSPTANSYHSDARRSEHKWSWTNRNYGGLLISITHIMELYQSYKMSGIQIFNQQLGHQQLYCSRFITVGEELTVSYLPDNIVGGVEERRKFLTENHNFICMCECCSLEPGVALKQDEYFRQIAVRRIGKFVGEVVNFYDVYFADDINILAKEIPLDLGDSKLKSKYKYSCLNLLSQLQKM